MAVIGPCTAPGAYSARLGHPSPGTSSLPYLQFQQQRRRSAAVGSALRRFSAIPMGSWVAHCEPSWNTLLHCTPSLVCDSTFVIRLLKPWSGEAEESLRARVELRQSCCVTDLAIMGQSEELSTKKRSGMLIEMTSSAARTSSKLRLVGSRSFWLSRSCSYSSHFLKAFPVLAFLSLILSPKTLLYCPRSRLLKRTIFVFITKASSLSVLLFSILLLSHMQCCSFIHRGTVRRPNASTLLNDATRSGNARTGFTRGAYNPPGWDA